MVGLAVGKEAVLRRLERPTKVGVSDNFEELVEEYSRKDVTKMDAISSCRFGRVLLSCDVLFSTAFGVVEQFNKNADLCLRHRSGGIHSHGHA